MELILAPTLVIIILIGLKILGLLNNTYQQKERRQRLITQRRKFRSENRLAKQRSW